MSDVLSWNTEDVSSWLEENGFQHYTNILCEVHKVDGPVLLTLTESDLRQPPLQIAVLGDIKRLMIAINNLQQSNHVNNRDNSYEGSRSFQSRRVRSMIKRRYADRPISLDSLTDDTSDANDSFFKKRSKHLKPEIWKTVLSFFYVFFVFLLSSFVMVIVHDRVPDMLKYPPLPDLFLDNIPYIPWAFEVCELVGVILLVLWAVILVFHRHRFILLRRMFSLAGTVFLLRCVTMLITSLSVPGVHLQCEGKAYGDIWAKLHRSIMIWRGFGMTLQGVRTCGDYMFSGHTVIITMLNFFITEYTHRNTVYFLHTFTWILNMFGIFFILAAHEHYSIDVFVAFYITTRLFMYYHTLANNRALAQTDSSRTRIWFPLFSFFESQCEGAVPNEYEWPLPWPKSFVKFFHGRLKKFR